MAKQSPERAVDAHYGRRDLGEAILQGLRAAGKDPDALAPEDLAPVDHFHLRGQAATLELARRVAAGFPSGLSSETRIVDVGGGIGGAARTLAGTFGCQTAVLDLTEAYCRVGEMLTKRTGLEDRVTFQHGSALAMPFSDGSFDVAWTEHSSMNIEDKERLYAEIFRVLRPGGRLALHEIMAGPVSSIYFPVPWATGPETSFLQPPEAIRRVLAETGFQEVVWVDVTAPAMAWLQERIAAAQSGVMPPLGVHLILGDEFRVMFGNVLRNIRENRLAVIQAVFDRP